MCVYFIFSNRLLVKKQFIYRFIWKEGFQVINSVDFGNIIFKMISLAENVIDNTPSFGEEEREG